jgi:secreted trypsin-like serine protease
MLAHVGRTVRFDETDDYEEIKLVSEVRHPAYINDQYNFDFMVLKLEQPSTHPLLKLNTDPALPEPDIPDGVRAIGFGLTEYYYDGSHGDTATILQEVDVDTLSNEECMLSRDADNQEEDLANGYDGLIKDDMLCAEGEGEDTCLGKFVGKVFLVSVWFSA